MMGHARRLLESICRRLIPGYLKLERIENRLNQIDFDRLIQLQRRLSGDNRQELVPYFSRLFELGQETGITEQKRDVPLVVSLTTIPERIHKVHLAIESVLRQSIKPDRIILWLDREHFDANRIPHALERQRDRGLTIEFCPNLRSFKKLIPCLKSHSDSIIVTCDDDVFYPRDWLCKLYDAYREDPHYVYCHRAHRISFDGEKINPYAKWQWEIDAGSEPSYLIFPTGVCGVLYFPGCFDDEVFREDRFLELCPYADDVWFKAMTVKNGVKTKLVPQQARLNKGDIWENIFIIPHTQDSSLGIRNVVQGEINRQIQDTFDFYRINKNALSR